MKPRTIIILIAAALVAAFVGINWAAFTTPTLLSIGFRNVEAPLGLLMLGLTVLVAIALLAYAGYLRRAALIQAGRTAEELRLQRRLADEAEASRFTELRTYLAGELQKRNETTEQFRNEVRARLESLERALQPGAFVEPAATAGQ